MSLASYHNAYCFNKDFLIPYSDSNQKNLLTEFLLETFAQPEQTGLKDKNHI